MNTTTNAATATETADTLGSFFAEAIAFEAMRAARLKALRAARAAARTQNASVLQMSRTAKTFDSTAQLRAAR
jgi:hypothetical protein